MSEPETVGSVAEEAAKLWHALGSVGHQDGAGHAEHVCTTTWCPVCQIVGFVRDNPDAVARLSESATAFAASLRDLLEAALPPREEA